MTKSKTRNPTGGVQHGAVQDRAGERGVVPEAEPDPGGAERQAERDRGQARGGQRDDARRDHGAPDQALTGQERSFAQCKSNTILKDKMNSTTCPDEPDMR